MENLPAAGGAPSNPGRLPKPPAGYTWQLALVSGLLNVGALRRLSMRGYFAHVPMPLSWDPPQLGFPSVDFPSSGERASMVSASAGVTELKVTLRSVGRQNATRTWEGMGLASSTLADTPRHCRVP
jgi:hypothetical protein